MNRPPVITTHDISSFDARDPFLFTSTRALTDWRAGIFTHPDGTLRTLPDLRWDLETEVMRRGSWTDEELQFRAILDMMIERGLIEETEYYWHNSPHGVVYRVKETVRFRLIGRSFTLHRGRDLVFQCRMTRERFGLRGPFRTGVFSAATESLLCEEMANTMLGRNRARCASRVSGPVDGHPLPAQNPVRSNLWNRGSLQSLWRRDPTASHSQEVSRPSEISPDLQVEEETRVIYLLIDVSTSMAGNRLTSAKRALLTFLRAIPTEPRYRVALRAFNTGVSALQGSLQTGFDAEIRRSLIQIASCLISDGSTALLQAVNRALDDLQLLIRDNRTPRWYLIVLSDGEDTQGIDCLYAGLKGKQALVRRVADLRTDGPLVYLPIAYGSTVKALDHIGGPGFHADVTDPGGILRKFDDIRRHLMLGIPTSSN
jgi:Mg-chelatase subunit ChlD